MNFERIGDGKNNQSQGFHRQQGGERMGKGEVVQILLRTEEKAKN
jgi:hypothetical protein